MLGYSDYHARDDMTVLVAGVWKNNAADTKIEKEIRIKMEREILAYIKQNRMIGKNDVVWQECPAEVTLWQCSAF